METNSFYPDAPVYDGNQRLSQLDEREKRMNAYVNLPDGRVWDGTHLDLVKDTNEVWAPHTVRRKLLIEAGARNVASAMILTESERERWMYHTECLAGVHGAAEMQRARAEGSGIKPFTLREL